ncbi:hypothetical protein [Mycolicibacterium xanthum]|uniref:hypothetical protein n=1 Tax=Mycolicibacterium xanthum TaxID=2796469 RepID=UPI0021052103|nr:hypothetical protein [Mycolicibacterium xanthum]
MTTNFSALGTKVKVGAAAAALATGAALTPAVAANADIAVPMPSAPAMSDIMAAPVLTSVGVAANSWFCFGPVQNCGHRNVYLSFQPLVLIPGLLQPFFGWLAAINFEACAFGVSVAAYNGSFTAAIGQGC